MTSRPCFSSYSCISRMSNFIKPAIPESMIWNTLYYSFINQHMELLKKNYAISIQVNNWLKKKIKRKL